MNVRERFHATCRFEKVDRPIYFDALGFWDETLARWHTEGLPETVIDAAFTAPDYFGFDSLSWLPIAANTDYEPGFWPAFTEEVINKPRTISSSGTWGAIRCGSGRTAAPPSPSTWITR